jgi:hypothetical protein
MKLRKKVVKKLQNRKAKAALMGALGFSEVWISKVIDTNKDNGPLTTAAALKVIEIETGLSQMEILEELESAAKI